MKRSTPLFLLTIALTFTISCSSIWEPSDSEAVRLVKNHYLFSMSGKEIDAQVVRRGEFNRECKCFPLKLKIMSKEQETFERTFYFSRNKAGTIQVSEYQFGMIK